MSNDRLLSKQEIVKIIKYEFDNRLNSKEPELRRCNEIHCVLSPTGHLSVVAVIPSNYELILSFDRKTSGDVMPMDRVEQAVDNSWWNLQGIKYTDYYKRLLDEIDSGH